MLGKPVRLRRCPRNGKQDSIAHTPLRPARPWEGGDQRFLQARRPVPKPRTGDRPLVPYPGTSGLSPVENLRHAGTLAARSKDGHEIPLHCGAREPRQPGRSGPGHHRIGTLQDVRPGGRYRHPGLERDQHTARYRGHHARGSRRGRSVVARRDPATQSGDRAARDRGPGPAADAFHSRRRNRADAGARRWAARGLGDRRHHVDRAHPARIDRAHRDRQGADVEPLRTRGDRRRHPDLHARQGRAASIRRRGLRHRQRPAPLGGAFHRRPTRVRSATTPTAIRTRTRS